MHKANRVQPVRVNIKEQENLKLNPQYLEYDAYFLFIMDMKFNCGVSSGSPVVILCFIIAANEWDKLRKFCNRMKNKKHSIA